MYVLSAISLMSAPAAKAFSLPVRMMAAIAGSLSNSSSAAPRSAISAAFSAFSACGRLRVTMPTGPRRSRRMLAYSVLLICDPLATPCDGGHHAILPACCQGAIDRGARRRSGRGHGQGAKTQQPRGKKTEIHQEETGASAIDDHHRGAQEAMTGRQRCRSLVSLRPPARQ